MHKRKNIDLDILTLGNQTYEITSVRHTNHQQAQYYRQQLALQVYSGSVRHGRALTVHLFFITLCTYRALT